MAKAGEATGDADRRRGGRRRAGADPNAGEEPGTTGWQRRDRRGTESAADAEDNAGSEQLAAHSKFASFRNVLCGYRTFENLMNSNAEKTAEIRRLCALEFRLLETAGLDGHSLQRYI